MPASNTWSTSSSESKVCAHCSRSLNYLGLPALSVPAGFTANGLPTGFQLVGRPFDEARLFRAARAYERETGWSEQAPPAL